LLLAVSKNGEKKRKTLFSLMPIILKSVVCELTYTNLISSVNIFDITVRVFKARKCCLLEECFKNV
jgi:hypothetical protein